MNNPLIGAIIFIFIVILVTSGGGKKDKPVVECVDVSPNNFTTPVWENRKETTSPSIEESSLKESSNEIRSLINSFRQDISNEINKNRGLINDGNINVMAFLDFLTKKVDLNESRLQKEYIKAQLERNKNEKERKILENERENRLAHDIEFALIGIFGGWLYHIYSHLKQ